MNIPLRGVTRAGLNELLRHDFGAFVHRVVQELSPGTKYQPNWHIEAAAHHLEQVRNGRLTRLIVFKHGIGTPFSG